MVINPKVNLSHQTQAYQYIAHLKETTKGVAVNHIEHQLIKIPYIKRLWSRKLAKYIGRNMNRIDESEERAYLQVLLKNMSVLTYVHWLVRKFNAMLGKGNDDIES